jgi:hypothetical protein
MIVIIDNWIKSVKNHINQQKKETPELRKYYGKFNENYIRERIYDYLSENMEMGFDGNYRIIIHSKDNSESAVLTVLESDENHLLCKENELENEVFYSTMLSLKYDDKTKKFIGMDLKPKLGYHEW